MIISSFIMSIDLSVSISSAEASEHTSAAFYAGLSDESRVILYTTIIETAARSDSSKLPTDIYEDIATRMKEEVDPSTTISDIIYAVTEARNAKNKDKLKQYKQQKKVAAAIPTGAMTRKRTVAVQAKEMKSKKKNKNHHQHHLLYLVMMIPQLIFILSIMLLLLMRY